MKTKLFYSFFLMFFVQALQAQVVTVSNNPNSPGEYTALQEAIDAAESGDTLYVHGSQISYGDVIITKPLTIIGAGAMPDKNFEMATLINKITFDHSVDDTSSGSGSRLYGCIVTEIDSWGGNITDIVIERCKITSITWDGYGNSEFVIQNNIISGIGAAYDGPVTNSIVKNNIIQSVSGFGGAFTIFTNNVVLSTFAGVYGLTISNNIFYLSNMPTSMTYCTYNNNIFKLYGEDAEFTDTFINSGTNSGTDNLLNVDPNFIHYAANISIPETLPMNYSYTSPAEGPFVDFHLAEGSPGIGYGTDGTDVGIYGGATPFVEGAQADSRFRYFPMPAIPQMLDMTINNTSVPANGTLNVTFSASKQD